MSGFTGGEERHNSTDMKKAIHMKKQLDQAYHFKITLQQTSPLIWRRIHVPASYAFRDLPVAIQESMGWTDTHLHEF